jgi:hypothetical protein
MRWKESKRCGWALPQPRSVDISGLLLSGAGSGSARHSGPGIRAVDLFHLLAQNLMGSMKINPHYL